RSQPRLPLREGRSHLALHVGRRDRRSVQRGQLGELRMPGELHRAGRQPAARTAQLRDQPRAPRAARSARALLMTRLEGRCLLLLAARRFSCASVRTDDNALRDGVERYTFHFFWGLADPQTLLIPDRAPTPSFSSIAAVGFGLTAYGIGAERGYVTRAQA